MGCGVEALGLSPGPLMDLGVLFSAGVCVEGAPVGSGNDFVVELVGTHATVSWWHVCQ